MVINSDKIASAANSCGRLEGPRVTMSSEPWAIHPSDSVETRCRKTALKWFPAQVQEVRICSLPIAYAQSSQSIVVPQFDNPHGLYVYLKLVGRYNLGHLDRRKCVSARRRRAEVEHWAVKKMQRAGVCPVGLIRRVMYRIGAMVWFGSVERTRGQFVAGAAE